MNTRVTLHEKPSIRDFGSAFASGGLPEYVYQNGEFSRL